jgi:hypothetical protein
MKPHTITLIFFFLQKKKTGLNLTTITTTMAAIAVVNVVYLLMHP